MFKNNMHTAFPGISKAAVRLKDKKAQQFLQNPVRTLNNRYYDQYLKFRVDSLVFIVS